MISKYPIITICGSMRYYTEMIQAAEKLTAHGWIVLSPFVTRYAGDMPADATKCMLDDMHRAKIDLSDAVLIIGEHQGESTLGEIAYAASKQITVFDSINQAMMFANDNPDKIERRPEGSKVGDLQVGFNLRLEDE